MSGHSKWSTIKHKKGAADKKRGALFSKLAKLITVAARGGGDPESNFSLRLIVDKAKAANMPKDNIERAIKKGTGEDKSGAALEEVVYEGYGPAGIAVLIKSITDNRNRTVSDIRNLMNKNGGNMAESGAVAWMFELKGVINTPAKASNENELKIIDAGAVDYKIEGDSIEIHTDPKELAQVRDKLEKTGFKTESAELSFLPKQEMKIEDLSMAKQVLNFIEALEDSDEVSELFTNFDIPDEILNKLSEE